MIENVFIIPVLQDTYIYRCIETLYKYTYPDFRVIVIDQTLKGLPDIPGVHMKIRPNRNLGFAKAMNEGIVHALHWNSPYITCMNDDVELINGKWWDGIMDTFNMESGKEILVVAPESPRIPLFGYGDTNNNYVEVIPYKETFSEDDYQYLLKGDFSTLKTDTKGNPLPKSFPSNYVGVCDAMAAWSPVFKRKCLLEIGLWDERFYPGGAEDYHMMCKIYSKGYRAVSTRKSWTWHWWSKSRGNESEIKKTGFPIEDKRRWADLSYLWPKELNENNPMDVWGMYTSKTDGTKKPFRGIIEPAENSVVEI